MPIDRQAENKRKKREYRILIVLALAFLFFVWLEVRLFAFGQEVNQPMFFFGLVNINLILLLGFSFFLLRNLFKAFVTQRRGLIGNSLKSRLIATFLGFSIIPTALMFIIAFFYITSSFDRWFNDKMQSVLKSAVEVKEEFYSSEKKKNFNSAFVLADRLDKVPDSSSWSDIVGTFRKEHSLDVVEIYKDLQSQRVLSQVPDTTLPVIPTAKLAALNRVLSKNLEITEILSLDTGHLVRVLVPLPGQTGVVGISSFIPNSMVGKMEDVALAYEEMRDIDDPLKSIYLIFLILMTCMILVSSVWFGLYIARHLSSALEKLGEATQKVAEGNYQQVEVDVVETEVQQLAENFNTMVEALTRSRVETVDANKSLKLTLKELEQRRQYTQVVLANVSTGVISFDENNNITMINEKAAQLLKLDRHSLLGKNAKDILGKKYYRLFNQMVVKMTNHKLPSIQKEVVFDLNEVSIPSILRISPLTNEDKKVIGKVVVFDDLPDVIQGQRAAAWKEVARRIAHEVKNPLTRIKLSAQRLQKKFPEQMADPVFKNCTTMIVEQTDSLKYLINEFSQFARLPETKTRRANINEILEKTIVFFEQAHRGIQFIGKIDEGLDPFFFDPEQLKRALFNLLQNSVNAVKGSERPEIYLETCFDRENSMVVISIKDNGRKVSEVEMRRMFEPYYSKSDGGSGLGLTIVKKIVEDHNGYIRVQHNQPMGLATRIELPYVDM